MPSRRLGQYELDYQLGAPSGMGSVFVATDVDLHREVAIKELLPHLSRDPDFAARFRAEAENLARLSHPNITTLYSLGREGESEYMVMELIRGHTLKEVMGHSRSLGQRESLAVIAQAASALAYAHRMGVIHRDIKPSNIMVTTDGLLKIMDFGISRARGSQRQTRDGGIVGTLLYISPEQLRSAEGDERSDMYSLAITLFEMLTSEAPFRASNEYELMRMHLEAPAPPISSLLASVDPQIDAAVARALAKNPDDRFATIDDFARALGVAAVQGDAVEILRRCHAQAFDAEATIILRPPAGSGGTRAAPSVARTATGGTATGGTATGGAALARATNSLFTEPPQPVPPPGQSNQAQERGPSRRGKARVAIWLTTILVMVGLGAGYLFLPVELSVALMEMVRGSRPVPATPPAQQAMAPSVTPQAPEPARSEPVAPPPVVLPPVVLPSVAVPMPQPTPEPPQPAQSVAPLPEVAQPAPALQQSTKPQAAPSAPEAVTPAPTQQAVLRPPNVIAPPDPPQVVPSPPAPPIVQAPGESPVVEGVVSAAAGTHALMIGGRFITLFGIEPNSPSQAQFDQDRLVVEKLIRGMTAACYQRPQNRFKCTGRNGDDLAMLVLKAGVVRPSLNAPPEYRNPR